MSDEPPLSPAPNEVDRLTRELASGDPARRHAAARELGEHRVPAATTALIGALRHPDAIVREEATFSLGRIGDPEAAEPLVAALRDPVAAAGAAHALVQLGDDSVVDELTGCLDAEEPLAVQSAAVHALANLGGEGVAERLIEIARDERREPAIRMAAESEVRALHGQPQKPGLGRLPLWLVGMLFVAGILAGGLYLGASPWILLAVACVLVAGGINWRR